MVGSLWFQPSVSSLLAQGTALQAISANIANATTDGYKRTEVSFATLMSRTVASAPAVTESNAPRNVQSDLGGVVAIQNNRISQAGSIVSTGANLDVAIAGNGFFVLATDPFQPTDIVYGRAGHFGLLPASTGQNGGVLVDNNGYAVLGWPVNNSGVATTSAAPAPMIIDFGSTSDPAHATSTVTVNGDLLATGDVGTATSLGVQTFDAAGQVHSLSLTLTKQAANLWSLGVDAGTGSTVTVAPAGAPGQPALLAFDTLGQPLSPSAYTVTVTQPGGATSSFQLDLGAIKESGSPTGGLSFEQDGYPAGALNSIAFDDAGRIVGTFDNGRTRPLYQLAIAEFVNPDGLAPVSGTVYAQTELSGSPSIGVAGDGARGSIVGGAIEQSNVDLAQEFSRMIMVQHAYNSAAQAFRTVDEMSQVARDLKQA